MTLEAPPAPPAGRRGWARPLIAVLAAVGLLLFGAVHHQQAVEMAGLERDGTGDPALHQLAFDIETTQLQQIGRMQGWLGLWGAAPLPTGGHMAWMASAAHSHGGASATSGAVDTMPGMATSEQLRQLRAASGQAMDVRFLQLMLRHLEGGVVLLQYATDHASVPEVRNLASQMLGAQLSESEYLRQLLTARGATPLPL